MAQRLLIDNRDGFGLRDMTAFLHDAGQFIRQRRNEPTLFDFQMIPLKGAAGWVRPERGAYVWFEDDRWDARDAQMHNGLLFTGYITDEPEPDFLGTNADEAVWTYKIRCSSDDFLLNIKKLPARTYINKTRGFILRDLVSELFAPRIEKAAGGVTIPPVNAEMPFDTSGILEGGIERIYQVDTGKVWTEIAREFAEIDEYVYRVLNGKIYYEPEDQERPPESDPRLEVIIDDQDPRYNPTNLTVNRIANQLYNDIIVLGKDEPTTVCREYFVSDGYQPAHYLTYVPFGLDLSTLLEDDLTADSIDGQWLQVDDPANYIRPFEGSLNIIGGTGVLGEVYLRSIKGFEVAGIIECRDGEIGFVPEASGKGIIGGLMTSDTMTLANCLLGFWIDADASATAAKIYPIVDGTVINTHALPALKSLTRKYILRKHIHCVNAFRGGNAYKSQLGQSYGSPYSQVSDIHVVWQVEQWDFDDPNNLIKSTNILYEYTLATSQDFVLYSPINSEDLHVVMNNVRVYRPSQVVVRVNDKLWPGFVGPYIDGGRCEVLVDNDTAKLAWYSVSLSSKGLSYVEEVRSDLPVHWWRFNEEVNPHTDQGILVVNGVQVGVVMPLTAVGGWTHEDIGLIADDSNGAIKFNGSTGYAYNTTAYTLPTAYTLEAWIQTDSSLTNPSTDENITDNVYTSLSAEPNSGIANFSAVAQDGGLVNSVTFPISYKYAVAPVDANGLVYGTPVESGAVSLTNVTKKVHLSWNAYGGASGIRVWRKIDGSTWALGSRLAQDLPGNSTTYDDLAPGYDSGIAAGWQVNTSLKKTLNGAIDAPNAALSREIGGGGAWPSGEGYRWGYITTLRNTEESAISNMVEFTGQDVGSENNTFYAAWDASTTSDVTGYRFYWGNVDNFNPAMSGPVSAIGGSAGNTPYIRYKDFTTTTNANTSPWPEDMVAPYGNGSCSFWTTATSDYDGNNYLVNTSTSDNWTINGSSQISYTVSAVIDGIEHATSVASTPIDLGIQKRGTNRTITVTWDAVTDADSYIVRRYAKGESFTREWTGITNPATGITDDLQVQTPITPVKGTAMAIIAGTATGFFFGLDEYGRLLFSHGSLVKRGNNVLNNDVPHHVVVTVNGSDVQLYVDGINENNSGLGGAAGGPTLKENIPLGLVWGRQHNWGVDDMGRRSSFGHGVWNAGVVPIAAPGPPTITSSVMQSGGNIDLNLVPWNNRIYVSARVKDASGNISQTDPAIMASRGAADLMGTTLVAGKHYVDYSENDRLLVVTFTWPAGATTGWTCRVELSWNYYGLRPEQFRDVSYPSTSASFDLFTKFALEQGVANRQAATGATLVPWNPGEPGYVAEPATSGGFFTVRAYSAAAGGEMGESGDSRVLIASWNRHALFSYWSQPTPSRIEWEPVSGATGYRIYHWKSIDDLETNPNPVPTGLIGYWDVGNVTMAEIWTDGRAGSFNYTTVTPPTPIGGASGALTVGRSDYAPFYSFAGIIDDVAIYHSALAKERIAAHASRGLAPVSEVVTIPPQGSKVEVFYYRNAEAMGRVRDFESVMEERARYRDDGVRQRIIRAGDVQPIPRNTEECLDLARAYLADFTVPQYDGSYSFITKKDHISELRYWPMPGDYIRCTIQLPERGIHDTTTSFYDTVDQAMRIEEVSSELLAEDVYEIRLRFDPYSAIKAAQKRLLWMRKSSLDEPSLQDTPIYDAEILNLHGDSLPRDPDAPVITSITTTDVIIRMPVAVPQLVGDISFDAGNLSEWTATHSSVNHELGVYRGATINGDYGQRSILNTAGSSDGAYGTMAVNIGRVDADFGMECWFRFNAYTSAGNNAADSKAICELRAKSTIPGLWVSIHDVAGHPVLQPGYTDAFGAPQTLTGTFTPALQTWYCLRLSAVDRTASSVTLRVEIASLQRDAGIGSITGQGWTEIASGTVNASGLTVQATPMGYASAGVVHVGESEAAVYTIDVDNVLCWKEAPPAEYFSGYEIRSSDSGWGQGGHIGRYDTNVFAMNRDRRDATYFIRPFIGPLADPTYYSRRSAMIRIAYPMPNNIAVPGFTWAIDEERYFIELYLAIPKGAKDWAGFIVYTGGSDSETLWHDTFESGLDLSVEYPYVSNAVKASGAGVAATYGIEVVDELSAAEIVKILDEVKVYGTIGEASADVYLNDTAPLVNAPLFSVADGDGLLNNWIFRINNDGSTLKVTFRNEANIIPEVSNFWPLKQWINVKVRWRQSTYDPIADAYLPNGFIQIYIDNGLVWQLEDLDTCYGTWGESPWKGVLLGNFLKADNFGFGSLGEFIHGPVIYEGDGITHKQVGGGVGAINDGYRVILTIDTTNPTSVFTSYNARTYNLINEYGPESVVTVGST